MCSKITALMIMMVVMVLVVVEPLVLTIIEGLEYVSDDFANDVRLGSGITQVM